MRRAFPLHQAGDVAGAEALYHEILALSPGDADAQFLLGRIARERGQTGEAERRIRAAIRANGAEAEFHRALADILLSREAWEEAAACSRRALALDAEDPQAWITLGRALRETRQTGEARACFEHAIRLAPESPASFLGAALVCSDLAQVDESIFHLRRARALAPSDAGLLSTYLFTLNLSTSLSREEIFREHLECERLLGALRRPARAAGPGGRLRIGYLSPDFRSHVVAFFIEPILAHHDRSRFEVYGYSLHPHRDHVTDRLQGKCDRWMDCATLTDEELAQRIESDRIDILVDLAGHTGGNRVAVIARHPAPVVVTWLGYLNTTGLRSVDYRITDSYADPPGLTERFHTERLMRMPASQWCREKPEPALAVTPLPALSTGAVRFGSFNKGPKLTRETLRLWSRLLLRVPRSTLLLVDIEDRRRDDIREAFRSNGVDASRLAFEGRLPYAQFLGVHAQVDVALDPHPYSGATTTIDSLWMGVPVLTLAGSAPISRSTASILATLDLRGWIARSEEEFLDVAALRCGDLPALASLRASLRTALEASPLMQCAEFTRQLERRYLEMWEERAGPANATR